MNEQAKNKFNRRQDAHGIRVMEATTERNRQRFKRNKDFQLARAEGEELNRQARLRIVDAIRRANALQD